MEGFDQTLDPPSQQASGQENALTRVQWENPPQQQSRASLGVAPGAAALANGGEQAPQGRDRYYTPTNQGGRAHPFERPDGYPGMNGNPNDQRPIPVDQRPTTGGGQQQTPTDGTGTQQPPKWKPKQEYDWNSKQPYGQTDQAQKPGTNSGTPGGSRGAPEGGGSLANRIMNFKAPSTGFLMSSVMAGTGALATEPLSKAMSLGADKLAAGAPGSAATRFGQFYGENFDKIKIHSTQIVKETGSITASFKELEALHKLDEGLLDKMSKGTVLTTQESAHLDKLKTALKIPPAAEGFDANANVMQRLIERQQILKPEALKVLDSKGTESLIANANARQVAVLTPEELVVLEQRQLALARVAGLNTAVKNAGTAKWFSTEGAIANFKGALGNGLTAFGLLEADRTWRANADGRGYKSWEAQSFLVPIAVTAGGNWKSKLLMGGGAVLTGHLVDGVLPETPGWMPKEMGRTTGWDAIFTGAAMMWPTKDVRAKAIAVGAGYVLGNVFEHFAEGENLGDKENRTIDAMGRDKRERSHDSMIKMVSTFKDTGKKEENLLVDTQNKIETAYKALYQQSRGEETYPTKLGYTRTAAATSRALGELRLERGTRLQGDGNSPTFVLEGLNLDLGGQALDYLRTSQNYTSNAKFFTGKMVGQEVTIKVGGQPEKTKIKESELGDLDKMSNETQRSIDAILGRHDIPKAAEQLKKFLDVGTVTNTRGETATLGKDRAFHKTFVEGINESLGKNMTLMINPQTGRLDKDYNPRATEMVAKLLRDQALSRIVQAQYKIDPKNGGGRDAGGAAAYLYGTPQGRNEVLPGMQTAKGYDGAEQMLQLADALAPNHPDTPQIKAILDSMAQPLEEARRRQLGTSNNPLNVEDGLNRYGPTKK